MTEYILDGSLIVAEKRGSTIIRYLYDDLGSPIGMILNGSKYLYEKNLHGDIVGIFNSSGTRVVSYAYDAWGNLVDSSYTTYSVFFYNPFRYRGYYHDSETGFYYQQSRYYDPATGRFLNGDSYVNANGDIIGYNMYSYCSNNPVMRKDTGGEFWDTVFDLVSLTFSVIDVINNPNDPLAWLGLAGDLIDVIPGVSGVGEATRALTKGGKVVNAVVDTADDIHDVAKTVDNIGDTAKAVDNISDATKTVNKGVCFVAGTLVESENGSVPIEKISAGMLVYAHNPDTGETELKDVVQTFVRETNELVHINVNGEEIITTPTHPFWVPQKGWTEAIQLRAKDRLQLLNGEYVIVEQVQHELLEAPVTVYNFEVEGFHTYYVGDTGVLVHNKCVGSYEIQFESGKNYVGKGSEARMKISARLRSKLNNDPVVLTSWEYAVDDNTAFVDEYFKMAVRGVNNANTYNKIWSPGRKIFINSIAKP